MLLPPALIGSLLWGYRPVRRAIRLGLVLPPGVRWYRLALTFCALYVFLTFPTVIFETALWLSLLAMAFAILMSVMLRAARLYVHPALHGFLSSMPDDGMALLESGGISTTGNAVAGRWLRRLVTASPAVALLFLPALAEPSRWFIWLLVGLGMCAPALLVSHRSAWTGPLLLVLISGGLAWHAITLQARLPSGRWETHWRSVSCSGQIALGGTGSAWCVDAQNDSVYRYDLASGRLLRRYAVDSPWGVFSATGDTAWVRQQPMNGLLRLHGAVADKPIAGWPVVGAMTESGDL